MKNIKFTNNPNWNPINKIIPGAKECLKSIVWKLNDNRFGACMSRPSKNQYHLKAKEKIVLSITIINNDDDRPCLQLCFINYTDNVYIDNINDFQDTLSTWCEKFITNPSFGKAHQNYIRKDIYPIEVVLNKAIVDGKKDNEDLVEFDGDKIHMASDRYKTFIKSGTKCVCCGLQGKYFAKERDWKSLRWHFNLYGINEKGEEILLTKDHIIPKSKGGQNEISNYQTMCSICNEAKGDNI